MKPINGGLIGFIFLKQFIVPLNVMYQVAIAAVVFQPSEWFCFSFSVTQLTAGMEYICSNLCLHYLHKELPETGIYFSSMLP